jgi:spermidine/putrescine transport system permease protein
MIVEDWKSNPKAFWTFAAPGTIWLILFFIIPLTFLFVMSFSTQTGPNTYDNWTSIQSYIRALNPDIISILIRTLWWSALATVACLLVAYPIALGICFAPERWRPLMLLLIILPFWINLLIRTNALKTVFSARGIVNTAFGWIGLGPFDIIGSTFAVIFGLWYVFLPFMVLPLYATIERLDKSYLEASLDLGASQFQTFFNVTLPLTMPGIITGIILVFIPCIGMFLISDELGGPRSWMIANVIQNQFGSANDWPFGSALSFILMAATIIVLVIQNEWQKRSKGVGA